MIDKQSTCNTSHTNVVFVIITVNVESSVLKVRFEKVRHQKVRSKKFCEKFGAKSSFHHFLNSPQVPSLLPLIDVLRFWFVRKFALWKFAKTIKS